MCFAFLDENLSGPPITTLFNLVTIVTMFGAGIAYDVQMIKFLQKREKQTVPQIPGQDQLVPWKSGPQEKEALTIPLSATIVNTIGIVFSKYASKYIVQDVVSSSSSQLSILDP